MSDTNSSMPCNDCLRPDEVLVRDGTAKLVLCWAAVCLAHRAQVCESKFVEAPRNRAIQLLELLRATSERRGMKECPSKPGEDAGMRSPMKWSFLESLHKKKWNAELTDMAKALAQREGLVRPSDIVSGFKGKSWFQFNGLCYSQDTLKALQRFAGKEADGEQEIPCKTLPLLRFLWGAAHSIERISVAAYEAGDASLGVFDRTTNYDDKRASPLPSSLVNRWARVFGFLPVSVSGDDVEDQIRVKYDEKITPVWDAFCGKEERLKTGVSLCGGTVQDFAKSFQELLDDPTYPDRVMNLARIIGKPVILTSDTWLENAGRKERDASDAPNQQLRTETPASERTRLVARHDPDANRDNIAMTIDSAPDWPKLTIKDLEYCIDPERRDSAAEHHTRICTQKLVLEWSWETADAVLLRGSRTERLRAFVCDNPELTLNATFDSLFVRVTISAQPGEVLPPSFEVAVDRLVLPEADIVPGKTHYFCLSLPDSAVVYGRFDLSTGRYCSLENEEGSLQRPNRTAATLIEKLDARIRNRLEPDRTGYVPLGRRIAVSVRPAEEGVS